MPQYWFHILDDDDALIEDTEGSDLPDDSAAYGEAVQSAREILADALEAGREPTGHAFLIVAEQGRPVGVVRFVDVLSQTFKSDLAHA